jgi:hypothetical protein
VTGKAECPSVRLVRFGSVRVGSVPFCSLFIYCDCLLLLPCVR